MLDLILMALKWLIFYEKSQKFAQHAAQLR